jgi:hypothetical protein
MGMFLLILLIEVMAALALGMLVSAGASSPEVATGIAIPITILFFLFSGFYSTYFCSTSLAFPIFIFCFIFCVFYFVLLLFKNVSKYPLPATSSQSHSVHLIYEVGLRGIK